MIDDRKNVVDLSEADLESPQVVRFDETASANAKQVQPIPKSGVAGWIQRTQYARQLLTRRSKALALAMVGGFAIGALGHTMLAKEGNSLPDASPVVQQSNSETTNAQEVSIDSSREAAVNDEIPPTRVSAMALQSAGRASSGTRNARVRAPTQRYPKAYRIAVIR